jgi:hypothetical protein
MAACRGCGIKQMRVRQKRLRAYAFAATAVAIRFAGLDGVAARPGVDIPLGDISLDDANWRLRILDQVGVVLGLDKNTGQIPGYVAVVLNWGIYALKRIGASPESCGEKDMVRFDDKTQKADFAAFNQNWPVIERLARALIERGKLSEAEVGAMLQTSQED